MPLFLVAAVVLGFLDIGQADRISLVALPSRFPQNGSRLHLICQHHYESRFNIVWKRNGSDVGEKCLSYRQIKTPIQCFENETSVEWILNPVTYATRGIWSCSHGSQTASVDIVVNVPQILSPPFIELPVVSAMQSASSSTSESKSGGEFELGTGSRSDPLDLIRGRSRGIKGFVFECSSRCASETRHLMWSFVNSTLPRKHPSSKVTHVETRHCPEGLSSAKSRALITCTYDSNGQSQPLNWEPEFSVPVDLRLSLIGLNIVYCSTDQPDRVPSTGRYWCSDNFYNGNSTAACTYVLCDGPQPPILTSGEQIAIQIAAFLLICITVAVCVFTWRSFRSEKAGCMNPYNGIVPSHQQEAQMEIVL
ncbi:hypothetical protein ECG_02571 [Echinococcus granulosus]|uniref:Expressed conserved protein n=1 Tax=Echinococcus granulosus TaxID=6210 RepID=A0A068WV41_ECHGR|nr:hypothetical protein ECG_02571 [Echinococcus granulosus]CDS21569.1 expressed conserved protein [Echinococcus granulosus]